MDTYEGKAAYGMHLCKSEAVKNAHARQQEGGVPDAEQAHLHPQCHHLPLEGHTISNQH
jgi:hypothetical protein